MTGASPCPTPLLHAVPGLATCSVTASPSRFGVLTLHSDSSPDFPRNNNSRSDKVLGPEDSWDLGLEDATGTLPPVSRGCCSRGLRGRPFKDAAPQPMPRHGLTEGWQRTPSFRLVVLPWHLAWRFAHNRCSRNTCSLIYQLEGDSWIQRARPHAGTAATLHQVLSGS